MYLLTAFPKNPCPTEVAPPAAAPSVGPEMEMASPVFIKTPQPELYPLLNTPLLTFRSSPTTTPNVHRCLPNKWNIKYGGVYNYNSEESEALKTG